MCAEVFLLHGFQHLQNRSRVVFFVLYALTTRLTSDTKHFVNAVKPLLLARQSFSIIKPKYGAKLFFSLFSIELVPQKKLFRITILKLEKDLAYFMFLDSSGSTYLTTRTFRALSSENYNNNLIIIMIIYCWLNSTINIFASNIVCMFLIEYDLSSIA